MWYKWLRPLVKEIGLDTRQNAGTARKIYRTLRFTNVWYSDDKIDSRHLHICTGLLCGLRRRFVTTVSCMAHLRCNSCTCRGHLQGSVRLFYSPIVLWVKTKVQNYEVCSVCVEGTLIPFYMTPPSRHITSRGGSKVLSHHRNVM